MNSKSVFNRDSSNTNKQSTPARRQSTTTYNARGGAKTPEELAALEARYAHGAEKYHYKCQAAVRQIMTTGQKCPDGYEMYLKPYKA